MKWIFRVFPCVLILLCILFLYVPSPVGLSDNGDFLRTTKPNYIEAVSPEDGRYVFQTEYKMDLDPFYKLVTYDPESVGYFSPQFFLVTASKLLNFGWNLLTNQDRENYNLFFLALLHILLLAFAYYLFLDHFKEKKLWFQLTAAVLFLFLFCDMGYILYFNSFYAEGFQFVLALLAVGICLKLPNTNKIRWIILYYIVLILFSGAKYANIPIGIVMGAVPFFLEQKRRKQAAVLFTLSAVVIVSLFSFVPEWMNNVTMYHSVFYGILKNSPTPEQDLKDLHLPEEYAVLANTNSYLTEYDIDIHGEQFDRDFYQTVSKVDVLRFYLTHPVRFLQKLNITAENTAYIRPPYLSNYTEGHERMTFCNRFSLWEHLRRGLKLDSLLMITAVLALFVMMIIRRRDKHTPLYIALLFSVLGAFVLPVLGNGEADLAKHTFAFIHFFDLCFLFIILWLIQRPWKQVLFGGLACVVLFTLLNLQITLPKSYDTLEEGAVVQLGGMLWQTEKIEGDKVLLIAKDSVGELPFDTSSRFGSSLWETSTLRRWLNEEFYNRFTPEEQEMILIVPQREILADEYNQDRDGGKHPFYWEFVPSTAASSYDGSYFKWVEDKIFLPDITCADLPVSETTWLNVPLTSGSSMVRTIEPNGMILHRDANTAHAVRPAVYIRPSEPVSGKGNVKNPFILK